VRGVGVGQIGVLFAPMPAFSGLDIAISPQKRVADGFPSVKKIELPYFFLVY